MDKLPDDVAVKDVGAMMSLHGRLHKRSRRASDPFADRGRLRRSIPKEPPIPTEISFTPDLLCKSVPNEGVLSTGLLQLIQSEEEDERRPDDDDVAMEGELARLEELCSSAHAENQSSDVDDGSVALLEELFSAEEEEQRQRGVARAQFEKSDAAIIPEPGEDQPRATVVETENEELAALKAKCAQLQSELEEERNRANNKEAAFAMLAHKYDQTLNEKSRLQEKFLNLQTENNQQSLHMRILTREIELLKRGNFSSESPTVGKIARRKSVEEFRSNSASADPLLERLCRRRMSVDVIERELAVLRGLDREGLDSSEPPPRTNSIQAMRIRRLTSQTSNVSTSNISEMSNPRPSVYNPTSTRDGSSLRDSLRSYDVPVSDFSRNDSDNKSASHSFQNSRVSWHNSKDSFTVDLSLDDGRSYDARYLENQNTVNFGTSLEGDDFADDLPSVHICQANSSRPGIDKMDSMRTLRASNSLTASMSMTEYSFQPSVRNGSSKDTSVRSRFGSQDYSANTESRDSKEWIELRDRLSKCTL